MPYTNPALLGGRCVAAYLDMLAYSEGTSTSPATKCDGYDVIVTGIDKKPEIFTDFSTHPFARGRPSKVINSRGLRSSAAGRYQFMLRDHAHYRTILHLPDFGPASQDKWAVQLIRECGALGDIQSGRLRSAIRKTRHLWASLPGAGYGQHENQFDALRAQYLLHGGEDNGG